MSVKFALLGAKVTITDIDHEAAIQTKNIIDKFFDKHKIPKAQLSVPKLDVSNREAVRTVARESVSILGDVDILINNAGIVQGKKF